MFCVIIYLLTFRGLVKWVKLWSPKPSISVRFTYSLPDVDNLQKYGVNIYKSTENVEFVRVLVCHKIGGKNDKRLCRFKKK